MKLSKSTDLNGVTIINANNVSLGKNINFGSKCILDGSAGSIIIENNVDIGHNCIIQSKSGQIHIKDNSIIRNNNIICAEKGIIELHENTSLGNFCIIDGTAGSVAIGKNTKIEDFSKLYCEGGVIWIGEDVRIDSQNEIRGKGHISLGNRCHLWSGSYINAFENPFTFEYRVTIGQKCVIAGKGRLSIGQLTMIGGQTYIVTETHGYQNPFVSFRNQDFKTKGISIGEDVWIAAACRIVDGVTVGNRALIGIGTIITKDVPEFMLALGTNQHHIKFFGDRREEFVRALEKQMSDKVISQRPINNIYPDTDSDSITKVKSDLVEKAWFELEDYLSENKGLSHFSLKELHQAFLNSFREG